MNKINFKEKKYVMPLLALPFLLLFVYVGAQLTREDTTEKDQPKELSLSLGRYAGFYYDEKRCLRCFFQERRQ